MKKFALYTAGAVLMLAAAACDRDLDLAHAYDNSSSSKPYDFDKDFNFDDYIDFGSFVVSDRVVCEQQPDIPRYSFWLDGKISVGKYDDSGRFTLYWSADNSLRQTSDSPWLEENVNALSAEMEVFGKDLEPVDGFYDGGAWFIGVHKLQDGRLAGFFHAESHWAGSNSAYKSIGVTYSRDNGLTWEKGSRILAGTDPKPENPAGQGVSYGLGDGCVVWNEALEHQRCAPLSGRRGFHHRGLQPAVATRRRKLQDRQPRRLCRRKPLGHVEPLPQQMGHGLPLLEPAHLSVDKQRRYRLGGPQVARPGRGEGHVSQSDQRRG